MKHRYFAVCAVLVLLAVSAWCVFELRKWGRTSGRGQNGRSKPQPSQTVDAGVATSSLSETFVLHLDPKVPLDEQIRRGKYSEIGPNINTANFSLTQPAGKHEVVLYDLRRDASLDQMIARMKSDGYRPATLDDALAMGQEFPERQRQNPIVFLGSVWTDAGGGRRVPVLDGWRGGRGLGLHWSGDGWLSGCRFAAVRDFPSGP